jgi:HTH-type transcriptional regulator, sugar sensing transcriptional regulator
MDTSSLKEAGLTEGEIKVYLALLEIGSSTTGPIVEKSKISRSIVYQILERLIEKGLVSYITKDKTKYFQAAQPNKILDYIDEREKELQLNKKNVENLLPSLLAKQKSSKKSEAQIFEGFKGIMTAHEKTYSKLEKGEEYLYLGISPLQDEKYNLFWQRDHTKRAREGINCRLLFNKDTDKKTLKNRNKYKGCDARYLSIDAKTPAWFLIYKDTVVVGLQSENGIAIEIVNQKISDSFKEYFEAFWKQTKPFK